MTDETESLLADALEDLRLARGEVADLRPRTARLEDDLRRLQEELSIVRTDLEDSWNQLGQLRHSPSWRVTMPLRIARRRRRR